MALTTKGYNLLYFTPKTFNTLILLCFRSILTTRINQCVQSFRCKIQYVGRAERPQHTKSVLLITNKRATKQIWRVEREENIKSGSVTLERDRQTDRDRDKDRERQRQRNTEREENIILYYTGIKI